MSLRGKRFRHLEGKRPQRAELQQAGNVFGDATETASSGATVACASCGAVLADARGSCARCTLPMARGPTAGPPMQAAQPRAASSNGSVRSSRFRAIGGGTPPGPASGESAASDPGDAAIAATVPAWRGEASPPDVAEEIRRKLGIPEARLEPQRQDPLAWAQEQLQRGSGTNWLLYLGGAYFARRLIGNVIGALVGVFLLAFFLLHRACS